ncbi:hypothetical protein D3C81_1527300 [compost metagenome]
MGQQTVPGKHFNWPAMPGLLQRHHGIDHGQARADDQYGRLRVKLTHLRDIPRIQRGGVEAAGGFLRGSRGREHSSRQDRVATAQCLTIAQCDLHRIGLDLQVDDLRAKVFNA